MGHKRLRFLAVVAAAMVFSLACGGTSGGGSPSKTFKIGLVTDTGGLNDKSFNHLADVGLEKAKTDFHVQGDVKESKTGDDYIPNLTDFASKKYDLVIGVGFLMQEAIGTVSGQFPNVHFAIIDGAGTEKNGKAKKNKHIIGAVGGVSIPPVNHYIAGYKWAAKMEDPMIQVQVGYSNNFNDPAKCKGVAQGQINAGADVLFQVAGGCGLGVLQAAGQAGVYSVGVDADQKDADPSVIASALKKVDVATYTAIQNVVQNKFQAGALTFSIANEGAGYAVDNFSLPADLKTELDKVQGQIRSGSLTPPADIPA